MRCVISQKEAPEWGLGAPKKRKGKLLETLCGAAEVSRCAKMQSGRVNQKQGAPQN